MGRVYATSTDLTEWYGDEPIPSDADRLLARASELIDELLIAARYKVDDAGMPTDPKTVETLRDATCAQVHYLDEVGDDTGAAQQFMSSTLGSATYTRGRASAAIGGSGGRYAPHAATLLRNAGLLPGNAIVSG